MKSFKISTLVIFLTLTLAAVGIITGCGGDGIFGYNGSTTPEDSQVFIIRGPLPDISNGGQNIRFAPSKGTSRAPFNGFYIGVQNLSATIAKPKISMNVEAGTFEVTHTITSQEVTPRIVLCKDNTETPILSVDPGRVPTSNEIPKTVKTIILNGVLMDTESTARTIIANEEGLTPSVPMVSLTPSEAQNTVVERNLNNDITAFEKVVQNTVNNSTVVTEMAKAIQTVNTVLMSNTIDNTVKNSLTQQLPKNTTPDTNTLLNVFTEVVKKSVDNPSVQNLLVQNELPREIVINGNKIDSQTEAGSIQSIVASNIKVPVDNSKPEITFCSLSPAVVKSGDMVSVLLRTSKPLSMIPTVKVFGRYAEIKQVSEDSFLAEIKIIDSDNGQVKFEISNIYDKFGNAGNIVTQVVNGTNSTVSQNVALMPPAFSVPSGIYYQNTTLEINSTNEIRFVKAIKNDTVKTINDLADPTAASPKYETPIALKTENGKDTEIFIKAITISNGQISPVMAANYYMSSPRVKITTPEFVTTEDNTVKVIGGLYYEPQTFTLNCKTPNVVFYLSTNPVNLKSQANIFSAGSSKTVTADSKTEDMKFYAIASRTDGSLEDSDTASIFFSIKNAPVTPKLSGTINITPESYTSYNTTKEIQISYTRAQDEGETVTVTLLYTLDGSVPTINNGYVYERPFNLNKNTTVRVVAYNKYYKLSDVRTVGYTINTGNLAKVAAPVISPNDGTTFEAQLKVEITCTTENAIIYFTSGAGAFDKTIWKKYYQPFYISASAKIRAIAIRDDMNNSDETSRTYSNIKYIPAPVIVTKGGLYDTTQAVELTCAVELAKIYYTLDGSEPNDANNPNRKIYSQATPILITRNTVLKTSSYLDGRQSSDVIRSEYQVRAPQPEFYVNDVKIQSAIFEDSGCVKIVSSVPNAKILYNIKKIEYKAPAYALINMPFDRSTALTYDPAAGVKIENNCYIVAIAYSNEFADSLSSTARFRVNVLAPVSNISADQVYNIGQKVELTTATKDAKIYYNVTPAGGNPNYDISTEYTSPIELKSNCAVYAVAKKDDCQNSNEFTKNYKVKLPAPVFGVEYMPNYGALMTAPAEFKNANIVFKTSIAPSDTVECTGLQPITDDNMTFTAFLTVDKNNLNPETRAYENSDPVTSSQYKKATDLSAVKIYNMTNVNKLALRNVTASMEYSLSGTDKTAAPDASWQAGTGSEIDLSAVESGKYIIVRDKNIPQLLRGMGRMYPALTNGFTANCESNRWAMNNAEKAIRLTSLKLDNQDINSTKFKLYVMFKETGSENWIVINDRTEQRSPALSAPSYGMYRLGGYPIPVNIQTGHAENVIVPTSNKYSYAADEKESVFLISDNDNGSAGANSADDIYINASAEYTQKSSLAQVIGDDYLDCSSTPVKLTAKTSRIGETLWVRFGSNSVLKDALTLNNGKIESGAIANAQYAVGDSIYVATNSNGNINIPVTFGTIPAIVQATGIDNSVHRKMKIIWEDPNTTVSKYRIYYAISANSNDIDTSAKVRTLAQNTNTGGIIEITPPATSTQSMDITDNYYMNYVIESISNTGNISQEITGTPVQEKQVDLNMATIEKSAVGNKLVLKKVTAGIEYSLDGTAPKTGVTWIEGSGDENNCPEIDLSSMTAGKFVVLRNKSLTTAIRGMGKVIAAPINAAISGNPDNRWAISVDYKRIIMTRLTDASGSFKCLVYSGENSNALNFVGESTITLLSQTGSTMSSSITKNSWPATEFISIYLKSDNSTLNDSSDDVYTQIAEPIHPLTAPVNGPLGTAGNFIIDSTSGSFVYDNNDNTKTGYQIIYVTNNDGPRQTASNVANGNFSYTRGVVLQTTGNTLKLKVIDLNGNESAYSETATISAAPVNGQLGTAGNFIVSAANGTITYDNTGNVKTGFKIAYSINNGTPVVSTNAAVNGSNLTVTNDALKTAGATVKVKTVDVKGNESNFSSVYTIAAAPVNGPLGTAGNFIINGMDGFFTYDNTGNAKTGLKLSYVINSGNPVEAGTIASNSNLTVSADELKTYRTIKIKTIDTIGNESPYSNIVSSSNSPNVGAIYANALDNKIYFVGSSSIYKLHVKIVTGTGTSVYRTKNVLANSSSSPAISDTNNFEKVSGADITAFDAGYHFYYSFENINSGNISAESDDGIIPVTPAGVDYSAGDLTKLSLEYSGSPVSYMALKSASGLSGTNCSVYVTASEENVTPVWYLLGNTDADGNLTPATTSLMPVSEYKATSKIRYYYKNSNGNISKISNIDGEVVKVTSFGNSRPVVQSRWAPIKVNFSGNGAKVLNSVSNVSPNILTVSTVNNPLAGFYFGLVNFQQNNEGTQLDMEIYLSGSNLSRNESGWGWKAHTDGNKIVSRQGGHVVFGDNNPIRALFEYAD